FFRDLPIANSKNCDCWPADRLPCHRMPTNMTGPFVAVHRPVTQSTRYSVLLGYQVMDSRRELAVHLENPFQRLLECFESPDWFWTLWPIYDAVFGNDFVKNIEVPLVHRFLEIATHNCFIGR